MHFSLTVSYTTAITMNHAVWDLLPITIMYSTLSMKGIKQLQERCRISRYKEGTNLYCKEMVSVSCIPINMAVTGESSWTHMVQWLWTWALFSSWLDTVLVLFFGGVGWDSLTSLNLSILLCKKELATTPPPLHWYTENILKKSHNKCSPVAQITVRVQGIFAIDYSLSSEWTDLQEQI